MSAEQLIMPRNKKSYTSLTAVIEKLERMNLDAMAEQLKEMDKSGELTSKSPLEVLDQLISFQSVENQNNTTERYKKKAKLYSPLADLQDLLYIPSRHINAALVPWRICRICCIFLPDILMRRWWISWQPINILITVGT